MIVSVSVLCNLKMTMQLLCVASVLELKYKYIRTYIHASTFPLPSGVIMQYCQSEQTVMVIFVSHVHFVTAHQYRTAIHSYIHSQEYIRDKSVQPCILACRTTFSKMT